MSAWWIVAVVVLVCWFGTALLIGSRLGAWAQKEDDEEERTGKMR